MGVRGGGWEGQGMSRQPFFSEPRETSEFLAFKVQVSAGACD